MAYFRGKQRERESKSEREREGKNNYFFSALDSLLSLSHRLQQFASNLFPNSITSLQPKATKMTRLFAILFALLAFDEFCI